MPKKFDAELVRCLLVWALITTVLVLFWFIFETIKTYQQICVEIEEYLQKSLLITNGTDTLDLFSDEIVDQMLDKRLVSMKELLSLLIHVVIVLFGFLTTFLNNNSLVAIFSLIITTGLMTNLFIPILYGNSLIILSVIVFTLSWLYFDLKSNVKVIEKRNRV